jgi:hypothetical protein
MGTASALARPGERGDGHAAPAWDAATGPHCRGSQDSDTGSPLTVCAIMPAATLAIFSEPP